MLRAAILRARAPVAGPLPATARAQWLLLRSPLAGQNTQALRYFADGKKPDENLMPGSQSRMASRVPPPPPPYPQDATPATPESTTAIPPAQVPKLPPSPQTVQTSPGSSIQSVSAASAGSSGSASAPPPPPPPPPKPKPKRRRFRNFLLISSTLLIVGYAGGVYASLVSDSVHDFFTEYVPFGEEAVLFFEEREFKKRFPSGGPTAQGPQGRLYPQVSGEHKVTIGGTSGASAKPASDASSATDTKSQSGSSRGGGGESSGRGEPATAKTVSSQPSTKGKAVVEKAKEAGSKAKETGKAKADQAKEEVKKKTDQVKDKVKEKAAPESKSDASQKTAPPAQPAQPPQAAEPSKAAPIALIEVLEVPNATDPIVQKLTGILNDVITAVNADNAGGKYSAIVGKAKDEVVGLAENIGTYRASESKAADEKIREAQQQFDEGARELISRIEREQRDQELQWREEYEAERERISKTYEQRLKAELEAQDKVSQQKLRNELLQQSIKSTDDFSATVRDQVESERSGRLSKLNELSETVAELEGLTGSWSEVIQSNLKTQHLLVAVEALRSTLENADRPKPFVSELVALKEIAGDDSVVNAAIGSVHPTSYQNGIPTLAQLIDRFRGVAQEVRKAALLPADAGIASHAASVVLSRLLFKKQGLAVGEDVESILTRTETLLEEGNLDAATREMNTLDGWAKVLSKDWLGECRRVLEVRQALDVIAAEARLQSLLVE